MVRLLITTLALLQLFTVSAQNKEVAKFSASAPKSVPVNQKFTLVFTLEGAAGSNFKLISPPPFEILSGPSTATSTQWINGVTSQTTSYSYVLKPYHEGTFSIGTARVTALGVSMESENFSITITAPAEELKEVTPAAKPQVSVDNHPNTKSDSIYMEGPDSVALNQKFTIKITANNLTAMPKIPSMAAFEIISGPTTSTTTTYANGSVTNSSSYSYLLKPLKQGVFKLESATILSNKTELKSNELSIRVTAPINNPKTLQIDGWLDDFFSQDKSVWPNKTYTLDPDSITDPAAQLKDDVFLKLSVDRDTVFRGEMVVASYKIYYNLDIDTADFNGLPAFPGFSCNAAPLSNQMKSVTEEIKGKKYYVADMVKYNLYPEVKGIINIEPLNLHVSVKVKLSFKSGDVFEDLFKDKLKNFPLDLKSNPSKVFVKELPAKGKPDDFTGAVGDFALESTRVPFKKEYKTGEKISFSVLISGTGNLRSVSAPEIKFPSSFKVLKPEIFNDITDNDSTGLSGIRRFTYTIIATKPGDYTIDEIPFSYFDPMKEKYVSDKLTGFSFMVSKN